MNKSPTMKDRLALALFSIMEHKVFGSISISEVAQAAEVNRSTIYRNFSGKEDIAKHRVAMVMDEYVEIPLLTRRSITSRIIWPRCSVRAKKRKGFFSSC